MLTIGREAMLHYVGHFVCISLLREGANLVYEACWSLSRVAMDITDQLFATNSDWDLQYLRQVFTQDFYEFDEIWQSSIM